MEWNGMEQFEGFKKLKKMKNGNGMEWEKWVNQIKGKNKHVPKIQYLVNLLPNFLLKT